MMVTGVIMLFGKIPQPMDMNHITMDIHINFLIRHLDSEKLILPKVALSHVKILLDFILKHFKNKMMQLVGYLVVMLHKLIVVII